MTLAVLVAVLVFSPMFASCIPGIHTSSPTVIDNNTISTKQNAAANPDSCEVDGMQTVCDPGPMLSKILFLRINHSDSIPNMYGKYDPTNVSRDIWVMDADGRNAVNLTKGCANTMTADWSPDKSKVVFDSVRNYVDGKPICAIYIMDSNDSNVKLVSPDGSSRHFPAWSPNGNRIAYSKFSLPNCGPAEWCKSFTLFTFNPDGSEDRQVMFSGTGRNIVLPRWLPDGKHIAFLDNVLGFSEIWSGDIVTDNDLKKYNIVSNPIYISWFSLSPDATRVVYSSDLFQYQRASDYYHTGREIFIFDTITGETTQLTQNDYADDYPCFSPDGKEVLFASFGDTKETCGMFTVDINGTILKRISSQYGDMPMEWR